MASLKRAMRWDEERFGREYDLDTFMIFCADDFNMGAMENKGLNIFNSRLVLADPESRDRRRLRRHRGRGRPRVLPQLDRQPRDLPRLVPAVAQGRAHGLSRPGVLRATSARARSSASRAVEYLRARAVPRGRGSDGASGAARRVPGDQQLLHGDRVREGRRGDPHAAHAARPERVPPRHGPVLRAPRRPRGHVRRLRRRRCRTRRASTSRSSALVRPGGHAVVAVARPLRRRARAPTRSSLRSAPRPTPGQPRKLPFHIPVRVGLVGPDGRDLPLRSQGEARAGAARRAC